MKQAKKLKTAEKPTATLQTELGLIEAEINSSFIEFKNAKKDDVMCPYGAFTHTGAIICDKEQDRDTWNVAMAVVFKVEAEKRRSGDVKAARAGHSMKQGTCSVTVRVGGMVSKKSPVTVQLAHAQKLASVAREIGAELTRRATAERLATEMAAKAKAVADVEAYLCGAPATVAA